VASHSHHTVAFGCDSDYDSAPLPLASHSGRRHVDNEYAPLTSIELLLHTDKLPRLRLSRGRHLHHLRGSAVALEEKVVPRPGQSDSSVFESCYQY
jgi:hypothetical protein